MAFDRTHVVLSLPDIIRQSIEKKGSGQALQYLQKIVEIIANEWRILKRIVIKGILEN